MKKKLCFLICLTVFSVCFAQETQTEKLSYQTALNLAVENNYDLQKQRAALASAVAQYKQVLGATDFNVGGQAGYQLSQQPKDHNDPSYEYGSYYYYTSGYGVYSDNTTSQNTQVSLYLQKLFSIGLSTKLSYSLQRNLSNSNFTYEDTSIYAKYLVPQGYNLDAKEKGHNYGTTTLELELPLFKSFKNSLTAMQLESAKSYIDQMDYSLQDAISKVIINTSQAYWQYLLAYKNYENLKDLLTEVEARCKNMDALIKAGVRTKNDLLQMQVNVLETARSVENAEINLKKAKMNLLLAVGVEDQNALGYPEAEFPVESIDINNLPVAPEVNDELISRVRENRPDIAVLKENLNIADTKIRMAEADLLPDVKLNFGLGVTGTTYSNNFGDILLSGFKNIRGANISGILGVSAQLENNTKEGILEQAEASYNSVLADYKKANNTLILELKNTTSNLNSYRNIVLSAGKTLQLNEELYNNELKRYNAGLITVNDLLTLDKNYLQAQLSYYQIYSDYINALLEYKYYTASLVEVDIENILKND